MTVRLLQCTWPKIGIKCVLLLKRGESEPQNASDVQYCHRLAVMENNVNVGEGTSQTLSV